MAPHFTYPTHYLDTEIVAHARPTYPTSHHCSPLMTDSEEHLMPPIYHGFRGKARFSSGHKSGPLRTSEDTFAGHAQGRPMNWRQQTEQSSTHIWSEDTDLGLR